MPAVGQVNDQAQFDEARHNFVRQVNFFGVSFVLLTSLQWLLLHIKFARDAQLQLPLELWLYLLLIVCALVFSGLFRRYRYNLRYNWLMLLAVVECLTVLFSFYLWQLSLSELLGLLVLTGLLVIVLRICGVFCPIRELPGEWVTCGVLWGVLIVVLICLATYVLTWLMEALLGFNIALLCMLLVAVPHHAQYVHGRLKFVVLSEHMLCAAVIDLHFILGFMSVCFIWLYATEFSYRQSK